MTPEQLFVSVQDAAAHALERLVRQEPGGAGLGRDVEKGWRKLKREAGRI